MEQKLNYLLDRTQDFGRDRVDMLDELTISITTGSPSVQYFETEAAMGFEIWRKLKEDDYFWYFSDKILEMSRVDETKVYILIILEDAIKQKWFALPENQRDSLKSYIVNVVLEYGGYENISKQMQNILSKANSVLVQIVKYEWNTTWTSFISDICSASLKDMNICENNFSILKMLSEEVFDYSKNQMTQKQISDLKQQMVKDFTTIFELCKLILENLAQAKQSLVKSCLETLHAFLSWIPMYYIIYTDLIDKLIFILQSEFLRPFAMGCLVEIAGLKIDANNRDETGKYLFLLKNFSIELHKILPLVTDNDRIEKLKETSRKKRNFEFLTKNITMFYSEYYKEQNNWLLSAIEGNNEMIEIFRAGFNYIIMIMRIDEDQVFKICIEFFHFYIGGYLESQKEGGFNISINNQPIFSVYKEVFLDVMKIISLKMAKPEEVLIVIDEDGVPVREEVENTENSSLYEIMKELAAFLVKVDWPEMKNFIINQIETQEKNESQFSFDTLNSLSWIVGSLCGSIPEKEEKSFFIASLRTLLHLCENKKGKNNKAVIASCIMYVVGQYPTFLRNNWTFLKTVIKKLFEFMKEEFEGVMEMACNAFLKIVKSTADQFVMVQANEKEPYILEIIRRIPEQTQKINSDSYKMIFYEAIGHLIGAENNSEVQIELTRETLGGYYYEFQNIVGDAEQSPNNLLEEQIEKKVYFFLKINETLATGIGQKYAIFLGTISEIINKFYIFYSSQVNEAIKNQGIKCLNYVTIKYMRAIKKQVIKVYIKYLEKCSDINNQQAEYILNTFIFPLGNLLKDFEECVPETKEQEFVNLFTLVLSKLYMVISPDFLATLVGMIFSSSLPLITTDFNSFPEIRAHFFAFLKALVQFNFEMLYELDEKNFEQVLNCVIWSMRHELSTFSDLGLDLLEEILTNVNKNQIIMNVFYPKYEMKILTDILDVMTDGFHKSGLESQSKIFYLLIQVAKSNIIQQSIASNQAQGQSNGEYLYNFLVEKLSQVFPNTSNSVTREKVNNWFQQNDEQQFKDEIGDYLILINRYTPGEITESQKDSVNKK